MSAGPGIVVTGIGLVTPLGLDRETTWKNLLAGRTGIRASGAGLAATVPDFSANGAPRPVTRPSYRSGRSRAGDFAVMAADEALRHAGLGLQSDRPMEIGCAVGQSKPILQSCHHEEPSEAGRRGDLIRSINCDQIATVPAFGRDLVMTASVLDASLALSSFTGWSLEAVVKSHFHLEGPSANVAAACATGVAALETAAGWIRSGRCDVTLAGAAESSLTDFFRAGFQQMGVLQGGSDPARVRPFDRARSGFAMGEGAAVMVLESEDSARRRGARVIARLGEVRLRHSVNDALRFDPDGSLIARLIQATCGDRRPSYVNAHGTGTVLNDASEARGLRRAFGDGALGVVVGSTKASTGHLLGAAGAVEAAFCVLAVRDGVAPPSLNVTDPAPDVDFALAGASPSAPVSSALSLSYGFGGQMAAVLFERS